MSVSQTETQRQPSKSHPLRARRIGIDTQYEAVVFMHKDCHVCRSEGFSAHNRVLLRTGEREVIATLYQVTRDLIAHDEAALSELGLAAAWSAGGRPDRRRHPAPSNSLGHVRSRIYGNALSEAALHAIIEDVVDGKYSDIHLSSFITACATRPLDHNEILALTNAMVEAGERLILAGRHDRRQAFVRRASRQSDHADHRADRRCARPDDAEDLVARHHVAGRHGRHDGDNGAGRARNCRQSVASSSSEGGCIVWGGAVKLSPADDILIRVERALDVDSEGQMIASVLSKKIAAGSTHVVIDMPVGQTAKVRSADVAQALTAGLSGVGENFGLRSCVVPSDGPQPVGRGIGPSLEARDVLAVLQMRTWRACRTARASDRAGRCVDRACRRRTKGQSRGLGRASARCRPRLGKIPAYLRSARRHARAARVAPATADPGRASRTGGRHRQPQDCKIGQARRSAGRQGGRRRPACSRRRFDHRRSAAVHGPCRSTRRTGLCPRLCGRQP